MNSLEEKLKMAEILYNAGYRKQSEVASEIFEEIHQKLDSQIELYGTLSIITSCQVSKKEYEISKKALIDVRHYIAELKKKYTEDKENDRT